MITVENLTKFYGGLCALQDVSFEVQKGEILGFLGPNGAGKTTTMRILTCFMPASSGAAQVAGFDVFNDAIEVRKRIGYLPESVPLYNNMTVNEYLYFVAEAKRIARSDRWRRIKEVVEECGLGEVHNRIIGKLSKGFRQRIGLAQALVNKPEVLILDEPTIGLDPKQIVEIRNLIKSLGGEHTIILSSHILPEVSMTCQRVVIISKGKVVAEDTPDNLSAQHGKSTRISLTVRGADAEVQRVLARVSGVHKVEKTNLIGETVTVVVETEKDSDIRPQLAEAVVTSSLDLLEMRSVSISLEEVFMHLTTDEQVNGGQEVAS